MKTQKINFSKLIFVVFCSLFLTAVGTTAHAGSISGNVSDGLGVYTPGNILIAAFTDSTSTTPVAGPVTITSLGAYTLPVGDAYGGLNLWVKARWDANTDGVGGSRNGGDVVGGSSSNPITFNSTTGNSGVNITLGGVLISGVIQAGVSGYSSPTHPNIYIGAFDGSGYMVNGTMVSALGTTYILSVPGSYLGQQLKIIAVWDSDGSSDSGPFPPIPTTGDWWGRYFPNPTLQVGTNSTINIPLTNEFFTVSGQVTRADGGAPAPNVEVDVRKDTACGGQEPLGFAMTDASGNYSLALPGGFQYFLYANPTITVPSPDLAPEWYTESTSYPYSPYYCQEATPINLFGNTSGINFALENGGSISGTVKDYNGNPVSGVTVEIYNDALGYGWRQETTDMNGNFMLENLSPGPWHVSVLPETLSGLVQFQREYWLNLSQDRNLGTISLQEGALVTGIFKDIANSPIANLNYWYTGRFELGDDQSDGSGNFEFRLPLGTYILNLDPMDSGYTMLPKEIEVTDLGATYDLGDLTAYNGATGDEITGTVTDGAIHNGQFQVVSFLNSQDYSPDKAGTLQPVGGGQPALPGDGAYSLFVPPLSPSQTVDVILVLYSQDVKGLESITVVDRIEEISTPASGQDLSYTSAGYTVDGYVKSSSAPAPPYRASVLLYKQPGDQFAGFADSDETGYYKLYNVPAGDYKTAVTHPRYPDETAWSSQFTVSADKTVPDIFMGEEGQKIRADFNGDGKADILWRNNTSGTVQVWLMDGGAATNGPYLARDLGWDIESVADFNNDGKADILWRNNTSGTIQVWLMNSGAATKGANLARDLGWSIESVADFNNDGKADILWRNNTSGTIQVWLMDGGAATKGANLARDLGWSIESVADFNNDGKADILWRNNTSGTIQVWLMNSGAATKGANLARDLGWSIESVADFNNDGKADILWRNNTSGTIQVWLMDGGAATKGANLARDLGWSIESVADFNNDGKADILWRNNTSGTIQVWLMDGGAATKGANLARDLGWSIENVADFNNDGKADILWRNNTSGTIQVWLMDGGAATKGANLARDLGWDIEDVADFSNDGKADILWRNNTSGTIQVWLMDGGAATKGAYLARDLVWEIQ